MSEKKRRDFFINIAAQESRGTRSGLVEPQPPELPEVVLPAPQAGAGYTFEPVNRLHTHEQLQQELIRFRQMYAPFQLDLAPKIQQTRKSIPISSFDWRVQTKADQQDFLAVLAGAGEWETISIPHYGEPIGKKTTYYRTTIQMNAEMLHKSDTLFLCFKAVDYKAHIFLNGSFVGSHEGFFAPFEFDIKAQLREGDNILLVRVDNDSINQGNKTWGLDEEGDKIYAATGLGWDNPYRGWHHCPPGMGIYQPVWVETRSCIHVHDIFVRPLPEQSKAEAWLEIHSCSQKYQKAQIELSVYGQNFEATVHEHIGFNPPEFGPGINYLRFDFKMDDARLWEPEEPWLYQVQVRIHDEDGNLLDAQKSTFGMRSFQMTSPPEPAWDIELKKSSEDNPEEVGYGAFYLNGKRIRLRGANTMGFEQQDVFHNDFDQLRDDILLAKICNMNFWRITQRPVQPEIYDFCDQLGFMVQTDLPLFGYLRRNQFAEAIRQSGEMEHLIRSHPSCILVTYINEPFPQSWDGKAHRHLLREEMERFFLASDQHVRLMNPDRVIKAADGDYDPPGPGMPDNHCYAFWHNGHGIDPGKLHRGFWQAVKPGWNFGCGEYGAEGLDPVDLMRRRYPPEWLPQTPEEERDWLPHSDMFAQSGNHHYMWHDTQHSLEDWVNATHRHQSWAMRLMTEAFRRDQRFSSHALHLFIDAFPSGFMKTLLDCERRPKPAYFTVREALTPLMANWRTDRFSFYEGETIRLEAWICNDRSVSLQGASLVYLLDINGETIASGRCAASVPVSTSSFQGFIEFTLPEVYTRSTAIAHLALIDSAGKTLHNTTLELQIFPASLASKANFSGRFCMVGKPDGEAMQLAHELGLNISPQLSADALILVDDYEQFLSQNKQIQEIVNQGAKLVFLSLPEGKYEIFDDNIQVLDCAMRPRHFVSRATGHPLVNDFMPDDFKFWFDPAFDRVTPFLPSTFQAPGWNAILTSGNGYIEETWYPSLVPALAAAERPFGQGAVMLCQVQLAGRTTTNPAAGIFASRICSGNW